MGRKAVCDYHAFSLTAFNVTNTNEHTSTLTSAVNVETVH